MSSTDDLSSRPASPSMSSSDESYSKTTENEEGTSDSPLPPPNQILRAANPLQWLYPGDIQVDLTSPPKLSPMELAQLKDYEVSSTAESQAASTVPNKGGESCNSFEYLNSDRNSGGSAGQYQAKSPFEREIQRLMKESRNSAAAAMTATATAISAKDNAQANNVIMINGNKTSGSSSGGSNHGAELGAEQHRPKNNQSILMCGLDAIREIAKNKNPSESSQM